MLGVSGSCSRECDEPLASKARHGLYQLQLPNYMISGPVLHETGVLEWRSAWHQRQE